MRREWEPEDLVECWTLLDSDWELVGNKRGATRLGFALLLKFFEQEARFPQHAGEVPQAAVEYVASQVRVDPDEFRAYDWSLVGADDGTCFGSVDTLPLGHGDSFHCSLLVSGRALVA